MREKKVAVMTIRMTPSTREAIENEARRRDWTPSKTAERILSAWAKQQTGSASENGKLENEMNIQLFQNEIGNINIQ